MELTKNYSILLGYLYKNELEFIEEISIIERMYLYPDIAAYIDDPGNIRRFLLIQKNHVGNISAYMKIGDDEKSLAEVGEVLSHFDKVHVQSDGVEKEYLEEKFYVSGGYQYLIMKLDLLKFNPVKDDRLSKITPDLPVEDLNQLSGNNPHRFREEVRHGIFWGHKTGGKWVSFAGAGVITRNSMYLYVHTDSDHRGKGLGRACVSKVMEEVLKAGKQPVYALDPANMPSLKIARSLGYVPFKTKECLFMGKWESRRKENDDRNIPESSFLA